jgi:hypothetical protein
LSGIEIREAGMIWPVQAAKAYLQEPVPSEVLVLV